MSEPYFLEFELEGLPKSPNALLGAHWTKRSKHAQFWKTLVLLATHRLRPATPLKRAKITFWRISSAQMDDDNLALSFKSVRDGLKECGIIEDDSPRCIETAYLQEKGSRGAGKIRVRIEELD